MTTDFSMTPQYNLSQKSVQWEQGCFMQTDMTKLMDEFRNFCAICLIMIAVTTVMTQTKQAL
jgi:hypothetical protein